MMLRRRRRRRARFGYGRGLVRLLLDRMPAPRPRRRHRYRVANRRRLMIAQAALALVAVVALALSASVIVRSVRTARLNRSLVAMHTVSGDAMEAEVAAPPLQTAKAGPASYQLARMGLPDGTPIQTAVPEIATAEAAGFYRTDLDILPDMQKLARTNPDTVGWLSISGVLYLPVVYRDNTYYLDHDFTGAKNASGTLFLDEGHPLTETAQNLLIHGHSMNDGSMFGLLTHYQRLDFLTAHPVVSFSTLWEKDDYAVFAVLKVSSRVNDARYFNYFTHPDFPSDDAFADYVRSVRERSMFNIPVDVEPGDALLTLSTCIDDDRLVVFARRRRASETRDELASAVEASIKA